MSRQFCWHWKVDSVADAARVLDEKVIGWPVPGDLDYIVDSIQSVSIISHGHLGVSVLVVANASKRDNNEDCTDQGS